MAGSDEGGLSGRREDCTPAAVDTVAVFAGLPSSNPIGLHGHLENPMTDLRFPLFLAFLAAVGACGDKEPVCDTMAVFAVTVDPIDPDGERISGASGTWATDDDGGDCETMTDGTLACAAEIAGEITVTVSAPGFEDAEASVTIEQGECHVEAKSIEVELTPPETCAGDPVRSVSVTIDASDDGTLTDLAVAWAKTDDSASGSCVEEEDGTFSCGADDLGEIEVTATADGYEAGSVTVVVEPDAEACHAQTELASITLEPTPAEVASGRLPARRSLPRDVPALERR